MAALAYWRADDLIEDSVFQHASNEVEVMKTHVDHGLDIVSGYRCLEDATEVVGGHHENYDGSGYLWAEGPWTKSCRH